jgi:hypothetical protein
MKGVSIARLVPGEATSRVSIPVKRKEEAEASGGRRTGAEGFWNARRLRRAAAVGEELGGFLRLLRCALARPGGEVDRRWCTGRGGRSFLGIHFSWGQLGLPTPGARESARPGRSRPLTISLCSQ